MVSQSKLRVQLRRPEIRQSVPRARGYIFAAAFLQFVLFPLLTQAQARIDSPNVTPPSRTGARPVRLPVVEGSDIRFSRLSTAQGLSQTRVAQIVQDNQGFMWLGTQNGLDRYDGYEYKVFTHDPTRENSLSCGFIHSLFKDRTGTLWVGCDQFLDRFDNVTETFTHYRLGADAPGVASNFVVQMTQDRTGQLWLATGNGLFRLNPDTGQIVHYLHDPSNSFSIGNSQIECTFEDSSGRFWLVDGDQVEEFDRTSGRVLSRIRLDDGAHDASLYEDHLGVMWVTYIPPGKGSGLALLDRASHRLIPYSLYDKGSGKQLYGGFTAALEDHKNTLWFASFGGGLLRFDREDNIFVRYRNHPGDIESLAADRVISLCEDREGNIWAGLHAKEPNLFRTEVAQFMPLPRNQSDPNSLGETLVNAVYQDHDDVLWTGTTGALNRIDPRSGQSISYPPPGSGMGIIAINEDTTGALWVGTYGAGLSRFDRKTGHYKTFLHRPGDPSSLSSNFVSRLLVGHDGTMWIATYNGLDRFNTTDGSFVTYKQYKNSDEEQYLNIVEDRTGSLWMGGVGGLNRFEPKTGQFTVYAHKVGDPGSLSDDIVLSVYVDHSGTVWVGTENGLNKLNAKDGAFIHFFVKDGLPSNEVSCVLGDEFGMLWMSTNRGLSKLDPVANKFTNYSTVDGLPGNDLTGWDACFKNRSGEMFFGGFSGGVAFFPKNITNTSFPPPLVLTEFKLGGHEVEVGPHSPLEKSISYADNLMLSHDNAIFSLRFAALTYYNPPASRYRYRLEGLDNDDWIEVGSDSRVATFSTLPVGKYTFRLQTATRHGSWGEPGLALTINSLPPWWGTWWFRLTCLCAFAGLLWTLYLLRLRQIGAEIRVRIEERLGERDRIARELHDTLLQGMQGLVLRFQGVAEQIPASSAAREKMERALDRADEVLIQGRDRVNNLRIASQTQALPAALDGVIKDLAFNECVECRVVLEGQPRDLHPLVRDEVYWIAHEALANAQKHSSAKQIEVEIGYDSALFRLRLRDDGCGIDPAIIEAGGKPGHWGMRGMRERAARIGAQLETWSKPGLGTELELKILGSIAYPSYAKGSRWQRFRQLWREENLQ